jgi:presequence protease
VQNKDVPELGLVAVELEHDRTKARLLHVARDDNNNVFSVGFRTRAPDNTGLPHILEHTTLCGSEKYDRTYDPLSWWTLTDKMM